MTTTCRLPHGADASTAETEQASAKPSADALFVAGATSLSAMAGVLAKTGKLAWISPGERPLRETLPGWGRRMLGAWMGTLAFSSAVLPLLATLVWRRERGVRRAIAPYALVLLIQILTEASFPRLFFPNITAITGVQYTCYRLWQLRRLRGALDGADVSDGLAHCATQGLLSLGLVLWAINLAFLLLVALPRIVGGTRDE